jgi:hypothetical protein
MASYTAEILVGPRYVLLMDEISTGLDSATIYTVVKCVVHICRQMLLHALLCMARPVRSYLPMCRWMRTISHALRLTTVISLLQPAPEVYNLFDDVVLLTDGCAVRTNCRGNRGALLPECAAVHQCRYLQTTAGEPVLNVLGTMLPRRKVMFHGPVDQALPFFETHLGFVCPLRKDAAAFLQEVTTPKGESKCRI